MSLPWDEVNAVPATHVAEVLGLKPARERDKFECPVHGGTDSLHAYQGGSRRGFYCWGSCQRAFSNVDLAAVTWGLSPEDGAAAAEACTRLAGLLGIVVLDDGPLPPAQRRSPGFRPTPTTPRGEIARPGGNTEVGSPGSREKSEGPVSEEESALTQLREEGYIPARREDVYAAVLAATTLTDRGAKYLEGRGLDGQAAEVYGFRSVDGPEGWRSLGEELTATFLPEELAIAGFFYRQGEEAEARLHLPYGGRAPALLIPYWLRKRPATLRLRRLDERADFKYLNLKGAPPAIPFNASALSRMTGTEEVHVTEGELDAWTLASCYDRRAVGLPGVSTSTEVLENLARGLERAGRVVVWLDADDAGPRGYRRFCDAAQAVLGQKWLTTRVVQRRPKGAKDVNEMHTKGLLEALRRVPSAGRS